jgi:fructose-1,6-bisphosphatase/inositol monophosphatase family enzyme
LGDVVAGAVFDAAHGELFTAAKGRGAWKDGVELEMRPGPKLGQALIGTGFGYEPQRRWHQGLVLSALLPHIRDIRRAGAAAVDLCSVACGRLDGYYESGLNVWDFAAGLLIVREAGGETGRLGHPAMPGAVVVAGQELFDDLVSALRLSGYGE